jgi:8-oxo-dGTP pyrophosphatase MutT (NUDIX family)
MAQRIDVTVAAIIEREQRFLLVEERVAGRLVLNQPAGHLEPQESLLAAVVRETLEETGHRFEPRALVGVYLWHSDEAATSFLRVTFCGPAHAPAAVPALDEGIVGVHWLSHGQIISREQDLRSPMVLRCLNDYLAGARFPLECLSHLTPPLESRVRAARG